MTAPDIYARPLKSRAMRLGIAVTLVLACLAKEASADGTVTLKSGTQNGVVVVDGQARVPMQNGVARVELGPGDHAVELLPNEIVRVPFPARKVVAGSLIGLGVVSLAISIGFLHEYSSNQDAEKSPTLRALYPQSQTPDSLCSGSSHAASLDEVCRLNDESKKHSIIAILTATNGIFMVTAGLITWFTGGTKERPAIVPVVAPGSAGLATFGRF